MAYIEKLKTGFLQVARDFVTRITIFSLISVFENFNRKTAHAGQVLRHIKSLFYSSFLKTESLHQICRLKILL